MKQALDIEQITATALSEILGYPVAEVTTKKVGTGQTGASYRLYLQAEQGPKTLLAKVAAGDLQARARVKGGYAAEVGFYDQLVDTIDARTPKCWYAAISEDHLHFTLLLEDLAPRVPGVQVEACDLVRAQAAIRNLAALHAPRWNDPKLFELGFLMNTHSPEAAAFIGQLTVSSAATYVESYRRELGEANAKTIIEAAAAIGRWIGKLAPNFSVLHGDYRLDNLMFGADPNDVVVLDWQTAAVGAPTRDLAYFLGTSLKTDQRREHESALVALYHQQLLDRGVEGYDFEQCFRDYRLGHLHAIMITTIGCVNATGERSAESDAMFLAMANRSSEAIRDLQTLDLVD
ncbi:phosphotransferase [Halioxenophilus sp. WMMB6]|uniref:phosphotransferase n=1 Tax=Halioxenophilus sp. WMMB6 TaxID=3073815 RepID=UPI00295EBD20|nr:phosphotransferase [Halioxenophilus sp. WMMB6]